MDQIQQFFHSLHGRGLEQLIQSGGMLLLFVIVFAETGLLVGFFLPGDSLLFVAGFLVGSSKLKPLSQGPVANLLLLQALLMTAAFIGNSTGYWFGAKAGPALFNRPNSRLFKREHLLKTQELWERYGGRTLIMAEFMPFARTFAPIVAGVAQMPYRRFILFNVAGVVIWVVSMTTLGFCLGNFEVVKQNLEKVIFLVVALSVAPAAVHVLKEWRRAQREKATRQSALSTGEGTPADAPIMERDASPAHAGSADE